MRNRQFAKNDGRDISGVVRITVICIISLLV